MPQLVEGLSHFFGRVEVLARGADGSRRHAEEALHRGRPLEAREHARALLEQVPGSSVGLALWADAAEGAWLNHEVVEALSQLSKAAPWRADVWWRLGRAGAHIGWPGAREALERAASTPLGPDPAPEQREAIRCSLFWLSDADLATGDPERALRWLGRVPVPMQGVDEELVLRHTECALAKGDIVRAQQWAEGLTESVMSTGRGALARARTMAGPTLGSTASDSEEGPDRALLMVAVRAYLLEAPGAAEFLGGLVARCRDAVLLAWVRDIVEGWGELGDPSWAAAFALAEGRRMDARAALMGGLETGSGRTVRALVRFAIDQRDAEALAALADRDPDSLSPSLLAIRDAAAMTAVGRGEEALNKLESVAAEDQAWADELRCGIAQTFTEPPVAQWSSVLGELSRAARLSDRLDLLTQVEALSVERTQPLRLSVIGEFNAGKSTFINALLGADVAPTGVIPTTATLHWVAFAPDPFARISVEGNRDRVVSHAELKSTLKKVASEGQRVTRVQIYAPIERLKQVEILDTPGFNAPDPDHIEAARSAFVEAHIAIWLFDATQPLKDSERGILDELRNLRVPVQALLNKSDRLSEDQLKEVVSHVTTHLSAAGLESMGDPIAFSARQSLLGRTGDEAALADSGWRAVEQFLESYVFDRSDLLRERALRRKAFMIADELEQLAQRAAQLELVASRDAERVREEKREVVARLQRDRAELSAEAQRRLGHAQRALDADLRPLAAVSEGMSSDTERAQYGASRAMLRLGDALADAVCEVAKTPRPPGYAEQIRALVGGAVVVLPNPHLLVEQPLDALVDVAIRLLSDELTRVVVGRGADAPSASLRSRLGALKAALCGDSTGQRVDDEPNPNPHQ